jgi:hypothetical protein
MWFLRRSTVATLLVSDVGIPSSLDQSQFAVLDNVPVLYFRHADNSAAIPCWCHRCAHHHGAAPSAPQTLSRHHCVPIFPLSRNSMVAVTFCCCCSGWQCRSSCAVDRDTKSGLLSSSDPLSLAGLCTIYPSNQQTFRTHTRY